MAPRARSVPAGWTRTRPRASRSSASSWWIALPDGTAPRASAIEQGYLAVGDDGVEVRVRRRAGPTDADGEVGPGHGAHRGGVRDRRAALRVAVAADRGPPRDQDAPPVPLDAGLDRRARRLQRRPRRAARPPRSSSPRSRRARRSTPPAWLGREVTGDRRYANQALALEGRHRNEGALIAGPSRARSDRRRRRPRPSSRRPDRGEEPRSGTQRHRPEDARLAHDVQRDGGSARG